MISKIILFWTSLVASLYLLVLYILQQGGYCYQNVWCDRYYGPAEFFGPILIIFPVLFLFSLITYKMADEIYKSWLKFTYFFMLPFVLLTIYFMSDMGDTGGIGAGGYFKGLVLFFLLFVFSLVSLILIIVKHITLHRKQNQSVVQK